MSHMSCGGQQCQAGPSFSPCSFPELKTRSGVLRQANLGNSSPLTERMKDTVGCLLEHEVSEAGIYWDHTKRPKASYEHLEKVYVVLFLDVSYR